MAASSSENVLITQTRSAIGSKPKQRGTLRALGLGRIGKMNVLADNADTRGQIAKVPHLIKVEAAPEGAIRTPCVRRSPKTSATEPKVKS